MSIKNLYLKRLVSFCFLLLTAGIHTSSTAQTTLSAGDIAFTGYNAFKNSSDFSFVLLAPISAGTPISFTDIGWNPVTTTLTATTNDGVFTWYSGSAMPAFTEVTISVGSGGTFINYVSAGSATSPSGSFVLGTAGDQILAFQGTQAAPTFLAAIHMNSEITIGTSAATSLTTWDDIKSSTGGGWIYNSARSSIPPGLTNGTNAVAVITGSAAPYTEWDDAKYNCSGSAGFASIAALRTAINNRDNWSVVDATPYLLPAGCAFSYASPSITSQPVSQAVCAGSNTSFSVAANNATTYQWQVNTGSGFSIISNGGIYSGAGTATLSLTGVSAAMNSYNYRVIINNSTATTISNSAVLTVSSPGVWLGGTSTAWSNAANWSCSILPATSTNVTIPAGTAYSPVIDITTASANNLTIAAGATLSFSGTTNSVSINGTLTNNGTFNPAGSKISFSGTNQTIPALTYQNLEVSNGGNKTLGGAVTVNGSITFRNTHIILGNYNLTIGSSGSYSGAGLTGYFITNGSGALVQSNIGAGGRTSYVVYPVGPSATSYNPLAISNSGTVDNFAARVADHLYYAYDANDNPTSVAVANSVVDKTWLISEGTPGGSNAGVIVQWNTADEMTGFTRSNCVLSHYYNNSWRNEGVAGAATAGNPCTFTATGITGFSPFGITNSSVILPVRWLSFAATPNGTGNVQLTWKIAGQQEVKNFVVEASTDGNRWSSIATIAATSAASYQYLYKIENRKALYYRVKEESADGNYSYSEIRKVETPVEKQQSYTLVANPVLNRTIDIEFRGTATKALLSITDAAGRVVVRQLWSGGAGKLQCKVLTPGVYHIRYSSEHTAVVVQ